MVQNVIMERVKVPAQFGYLRVLRKFVSQLGKKYNFTPSELYAFTASVDEACTNIIEHGYGQKDGSITMKAIVKNESFTIELVDRGKTFDPNQVARPDLQEYVNQRKKGGLGLFIIHKLIDQIDYFTSIEGNVLRLTKFRQREQEAEVTVPMSPFSRIKKFFHNL